MTMNFSTPVLGGPASSRTVRTRSGAGDRSTALNMSASRTPCAVPRDADDL